MGMELILTSGILATLLAEAAKAAPDEACGLLLGAIGADGTERITHTIAAANVAPDPARHFEIDPAALIAAHRAERQGGPVLLGYYHSHPTGCASPSVTDTLMAGHDGRIWAIVAGGAVQFWRDASGGFYRLSTSADEG